MNYLTHGIRYLDRPYFLAGTATPDWLSVADRRVRLRERGVSPVASAADEPLAASEFAAGVLQHLHDDRWFHATRGFHEVTAGMTLLLRDDLGNGDRWRTSFLGHIVTELLLDTVLDEHHPGHLDTYYATLAEVDTDLIEGTVNRMARGETRRLGMFVRLFLDERFLYDYRQSDRLMFRLNQVMRRVKLSPLPASTANVLDAGLDLVRARWRDLLPTNRFVWPGICVPEDELP